MLEKHGIRLFFLGGGGNIIGVGGRLVERRTTQKSTHRDQCVNLFFFLWKVFFFFDLF